MVLESTIICCDNSNYQRNGDYIPTRLSAQTEAINLISLSKIRSHPENNVALITMANKVEVLTTLTSDIGKISVKMGQVSPSGNINLITSLRIAHLVLKHRQGKHFRMRIVAFVGSPLSNDITDELVNLAKRFKKEKVQVDIISFGGHEGNEIVLTKFIETLNGKDGNSSHVVDIPRGHEIMDLLIHSPILLGENGEDATGLTSTYEYGVDPNEDPDLALALRISAEEERLRQVDLHRTQDTEASTSKSPRKKDNPTADFTNMTEEQQIAYVLEMSLKQNETEKPNIEEENNTPSEENNTSSQGFFSRKRKSKDKENDEAKEKKKKK